MKVKQVFERHEVKYLLSPKAYEHIIGEVKKHMDLDEFGHSQICNIYYDTPDYLLIRRSLDHPMYKEKIRVRSYGVASPEQKVFVELKKKYDGIVYKRRTSCIEKNIDEFFREDSYKTSQIAREIRYTYRKYKDIGPKVYLSYEREAYFPKDGSDALRVTFDENILFRQDRLSLCEGPSGEHILQDGQVLMELKFADSIPFWMARTLSEEGVYRCSFSKYGRAYMNICKGEKNHATAI